VNIESADDRSWIGTVGEVQCERMNCQQSTDSDQSSSSSIDVRFSRLLLMCK